MREVAHYQILVSLYIFLIISQIFLLASICEKSISYYPLVGRGCTYIFLLTNIIYYISKIRGLYISIAKLDVSMKFFISFISFCGDHISLQRERLHSCVDACDFRVNQLKRVRFDGRTPDNCRVEIYGRA